MWRPFVLLFMIGLCLTGPARAADDPYSCIRQFLSGTAYIDAAATEPRLLAAAELLRQRLELTRQLQPLDAATARAWCDVLSGPEGEALRTAALLALTPVEPKGIADVDDGIGPMPFNFQPYTLASRYDGLECRFIIAAPLRKAEGYFGVEQGHLRFHDSKWWIGGGASADTFNRFNLALTEQGTLVGKFPSYLNVVNIGEVAQETHTVALDGKQGVLGTDQPVGMIKMPVDVNTKAFFHVVSCAHSGEPMPLQYASGLGKAKLDAKIDNVQCEVELNHLEEEVTPPIGTGTLEFHKGLGHFVQGSWTTGGLDADFQNATLGVTTDRRLIGAMDVWWLTQNPPEVKPPALIVLTGTEGNLDKVMLTGLLTFPDDNGSSKGTLKIVRCHETGSTEPLGGKEPPSDYGYDFKKEKLSDRYDGMSCHFDIRVKEEVRDEPVAGGTLTFEGSQLILKGVWYVRGLATPESFKKTNLRVTEAGQVIGKLPMFPWVANGVDFKPYPALPITLKSSAKGTLGDPKPEGIITFPVTKWLQASLRVSRCK